MARPSNTRESKRQCTLRKLERLAASTPYSPEAEAAKSKVEQLKIHHISVTIRPPSPREPGGVVEPGFFFTEDGGRLLVICNADGTPRKHHSIQTRVELLPDQIPAVRAHQLLKQMYEERYPNSDFYRPISYPQRGPLV